MVVPAPGPATATAPAQACPPPAAHPQRRGDAAPARDQVPQRPPGAAAELPPRIAPLPDAGWSDGEPTRADVFDHPEPQMPEPPPRPVRPSFADEMRRPGPPPPERR